MHASGVQADGEINRDGLRGQYYAAHRGDLLPDAPFSLRVCGVTQREISN